MVLHVRIVLWLRVVARKAVEHTPRGCHAEFLTGQNANSTRIGMVDVPLQTVVGLEVKPGLWASLMVRQGHDVNAAVFVCENDVGDDQVLIRSGRDGHSGRTLYGSTE